VKKKEIKKNQLVAEAKERAITALEEMKEQVDKLAQSNAMMDEPNADYWDTNADEKKAIIDMSIKALKDVAWEDQNSLIIDTIVKAVLKI
jgi:uncharacterized protein YbaP (TraB family)